MTRTWISLGKQERVNVAFLFGCRLVTLYGGMARRLRGWGSIPVEEAKTRFLALGVEQKFVDSFFAYRSRRGIA